eukprot:scaffold388_cov380-Prasinococcus_capsulatus_cf.AAC.26
MNFPQWQWQDLVASIREEVRAARDALAGEVEALVARTLALEQASAQSRNGFAELEVHRSRLLLAGPLARAGMNP